MADPVAAQSYANHSRIVPLYHYVAVPILALNQLWALYVLFRDPGAATAMAVLTAFALLLVVYYTRIFPLTVQDRLIGVEERERLARLAPELAARAGELRRGQLVALRFASDAELPALARRALDEHLEPKAIKQAIQTWRPDRLRV
ncbi:MAG TPA: DUF6526 family protein [Thermoanaerobaculia bacterium]|nr:DUF6526 family protein [Thermoanaerobaculia bacterium]